MKNFTFEEIKDALLDRIKEFRFCSAWKEISLGEGFFYMNVTEALDASALGKTVEAFCAVINTETAEVKFFSLSKLMPELWEG
jgi:hypothetical protein